ncbi:hypothetical protein BK131_23635 [Paenibacillus amylolyticus]|uniref:Uncharacterized protein n=1 Tax=Paenibacillus amylolyticus TaxID=1451 RepID=A0A1R1BL51_PAEAM|nr:hypothetical protein [Paenibacillus amylolyticus]OMF10610.1 hypothetical protein BK131_23635 [Paenibacillus amylolyticus]
MDSILNHIDFSEYGITTEEVIESDDNHQSNDPYITVYHYKENVAYGTIFVWETNDTIFEVLDWETSDNVFKSHTNNNNLDEFRRSFNLYRYCMMLGDIWKPLREILEEQDGNQLVELFHNIPNQVLVIYTNELALEFLTVLRRYSESIKKHVNNYRYDFAEVVGEKMEELYLYSSLPEIKMHSLINIMVAANHLNRFSVMDQFDRLLKQVSNDEEARLVAKGLQSEILEYSLLYKRITKSELHPAIQKVWEQCEIEI